jgi:hypothetical protein
LDAHHRHRGTHGAERAHDDLDRLVDDRLGRLLQRRASRFYRTHTMPVQVRGRGVEAFERRRREPTCGSPALNVGPLAALAAGAKSDVYVRIVGTNGNGSADPSWYAVRVQLK